MGNWTPGPWKVVTDAENNYPAEVHGLTKRGLSKAVARVARHPNGDVLANAAVLAAAPDLLEALQHIADFTAYANCDICQDMNGVARKAIARATGETP